MPDPTPPTDARTALLAAGAIGLASLLGFSRSPRPVETSRPDSTSGTSSASSASSSSVQYWFRPPLCISTSAMASYHQSPSSLGCRILARRRAHSRNHRRLDAPLHRALLASLHRALRRHYRCRTLAPGRRQLTYFRVTTNTSLPVVDSVVSSFRIVAETADTLAVLTNGCFSWKGVEPIGFQQSRPPLYLQYLAADTAPLLGKKGTVVSKIRRTTSSMWSPTGFRTWRQDCDRRRDGVYPPD